MPFRWTLQVPPGWRTSPWSAPVDGCGVCVCCVLVGVRKVCFVLALGTWGGNSLRAQVFDYLWHGLSLWHLFTFLFFVYLREEQSSNNQNSCDLEVYYNAED